MNKLTAYIFKGIGYGAGAGLGVGFLFLCISALAVGAISFLPIPQGQSWGSGFWPMFFMLVGLFTAFGAITGLIFGIQYQRNEGAKRDHPEREATYRVTRAVPLSDVPAFIKEVTDGYLTEQGARISASSAKLTKGPDGEQTYQYSAMVHADFSSWDYSVKISDVPGQTDKLLTITSDLGQYGSKLLDYSWQLGRGA